MDDFDKWWVLNRDRFDVKESDARVIWKEGHIAGLAQGRKDAETDKLWGDFPDTMGA